MYVDFTPKQENLRGQIREYFENLMTPERKRSLIGVYQGKEYKETIRQIGKDGWLGVGWPSEYGGHGFTALEQLIFVDEARRTGAPLPFVTLNTVGPALMVHGTDEQKGQFLPRILAGDIHFAIGYSEPNAGTDLAALATKAERNGDEYVVNGTKMFTSGAGDADYIWLAARTDPTVKKHKGITMLMASTEDPGFSASPIHTVGGGRTHMSYYEDVRVPVNMRVGEENAGWGIVTLQLNHERIGLGAWGCVASRIVDDVISWAQETETDDGSKVADQGWVQNALGEAYARVEAAKVMNWRMAWLVEQGRLPPANASGVKVYGTETLIEIYSRLTDVLGAQGMIKSDSPGALLLGAVEREYRACQINTFGGGVNEIQRTILATMGLGMPRK